MKTIVLKLGGAVCLRPETLEALTTGLRDMLAAGIKPVLVHGGGPQLDTAIQALGEPVVKHQGLRYTSKAAAAVVERELDQIGMQLTAALRENGIPARHVGTDGRSVQAQVKKLPDGYDLGRVGTFDAIEASAFVDTDDEVTVPVITPVGFDEEGPLNVNADEAAAGIAAALRADRLFLATDVPNVRDGDGKALSDIDEAAAAALILDGAAQGGMIPKLMAALSALEGGVADVLITTPEPAAICVAMEPAPGVGTVIKASASIRITFKADTIQVHPVEA